MRNPSPYDYLPSETVSPAENRNPVNKAICWFRLRLIVNAGKILESIEVVID